MEKKRQVQKKEKKKGGLAQVKEFRGVWCVCACVQRMKGCVGN